MNRRVGGRAHGLINRYAEAFMGDVAGLEIELIDIGDATRAIHHSVALDTQLLAVSPRFTWTPVCMTMPMRRLSLRTCSTASASSAGNSCGSTSRTVTLAPARA